MVSPSKRKQTAFPSQLDRGRNINATTARVGRYKIRDLVLVAIDHIKPHPRNAQSPSYRRINSPASVAGSPHSRRAAATTPRSSTPPRPNLAASLAARLLN